MGGLTYTAITSLGGYIADAPGSFAWGHGPGGPRLLHYEVT